MKKILFALLPLLLLLGCSSSKYENVTADNGIVKIPISEVSDGHAHFYEMNEGGKTSKFFILKSRDGVYRAAFDACDVCYPEKKGYSQKGDYMICNNCGQRFHSTKINVLRGGCNPSPLKRKYDDSYVYLNASDIMKGSYYF
ncbi:DUF2318 domain-containing protein [Flexistipes sinusarabici]|uniref:DUF2318 domain-containing protein n=1 Tax=Flexistipes sinusarabici TaxID=2352 RepID=A0A3D5QEQ8_FLESI|nr:DUF2318 domain-containing protein [Flexistipes sinusarabici]HCW94213.1 DUF2318 domain-containing protein [Flexistipes sinusarabici]